MNSCKKNGFTLLRNPEANIMEHTASIEPLPTDLKGYSTSNELIQTLSIGLFTVWTFIKTFTFIVIFLYLNLEINKLFNYRCCKPKLSSLCLLHL